MSVRKKWLKRVGGAYVTCPMYSINIYNKLNVTNYDGYAPLGDFEPFSIATTVTVKANNTILFICSMV